MRRPWPARASKQARPRRATPVKNGIQVYKVTGCLTAGLEIMHISVVCVTVVALESCCYLFTGDYVVGGSVIVMATATSAKCL